MPQLIKGAHSGVFTPKSEAKTIASQMPQLIKGAHTRVLLEKQGAFAGRACGKRKLFDERSEEFFLGTTEFTEGE